MISNLLPQRKVYLSESTVIEATELNGRLLKARGVKATVEQLELNIVRVATKAKEYYLELSDTVQWVPDHV